MGSLFERRMTGAAVAAVGLALAVGPSVDAHAATNGTVYLVQGVADSPMTITLDGQSVATSAAAKTIVGPLSLAPGNHAVTASGGSSTDAVSATVSVADGGNVDVVLHRQVDPSKPPVFTTFANDLSPVAAGSGRLAVAHTAAVGPADVRVDQKVLFSNIASGEALTVVAPAGTHTVDIVPTATSGPVVFGPAQLPVTDTALTRVFAIGVAATGSMDAVVQVLPVSVRGAGTAPSSVNAGDGGQAAALIADAHRGDGPGLAVVVVLGVLFAGFLLGSTAVALGAWGSSLLRGARVIAALYAAGVSVALTAACSSPGVSAPGIGSAGATTTPSAPVTTTAGDTTSTSAPSRTGPLTVSTPVAPTASIGSATDAPDAPSAQAGRNAASQRHPFAPTSITLEVHGVKAATASIQTIDTTPSGELSLPVDPGKVGWWQSGAQAGDAYGSVVLAGHIDSRDFGVGYFLRLQGIEPGDEVVLTADTNSQRYRVTSKENVPKASLSTGTDTFSQQVPGRLVLLTCTGPYDPTTHYPDNLVVTAEPIDGSAS